MGKTVLILRHAKSSWADGGLADHDRPLNRRGRRDAPRMGRLLQVEGLLPNLIITSTARRARETAYALAEASGYSGEIEETRAFYHAGPGAYLERLRRLPASVERVLLVGHNPGMEELVAALTGAGQRFPTAGLAEVALSGTAWDRVQAGGRYELRRFWRPKDLD